MRKKKILLIDDSAFIAEYISRVLANADYQVFTALNGFDGLRMVKECKPDLILLDVVLPDMGGFEVCKILRDDIKNNLRPIIMLTSQHDEDDKLTGLELGADDYITKPFNERELISRVRNTLKRIDRNRYANPLTGLEGNLVIESQIADKLRDGSRFAVIYADLDNFKAFNDVYGFAQGDVAIQLTADILTDQVASIGGPTDFVGHIGGDDFVLIVAPEIAEAVCRAVIDAFDQQIRTLYNETDLEAGQIVTTDRRGNPTQYPIMSISMAIVTNGCRNFHSHIEVAETAAELKKLAKSMPGSVYIKDRRTH